jgi:hypothetical protein
MALMVAHRLYFLLTLILIAYIIAKSTLYFESRLHINYYLGRLPKDSFFFALFILFVSLFMVQFSGFGFYNGIWLDYQSGAFGNGTSVPILLLNLCSNYVGQMGTLIFWGPIGLLMIMRKKSKDANDIFLICLLLETTLILALGLYMAPFLLPFVSLLAAFSLCGISCSKKMISSDKFGGISANISLIKKNFSIIIFIFLMASIIFSGYMVQRHMYMPVGDTGDKTWMTREPYVGSFLKENGANVFLSNDPLISWRIYASANVPFLIDGIPALINSWIGKGELKTRPISFSTITIELDNIFSLIKIPSICVENLIIYNTALQDSKSKKILAKYKIYNFVINNKFQNKLAGWYFYTQPSTTVKSVTDHGFRIYDNQQESVWRIGRNIIW